MKRLCMLPVIAILMMTMTSCNIRGLLALKADRWKTVNETLSLADVSGFTAVPSATPTGTLQADMSPKGTANPNRAITIHEQVLYNKDSIKITAREQRINHEVGTEIVALIENNSDRQIIVDISAAAINGLMVKGMLYSEVAAGEKAYARIMFMDTDLSEAGIKAIWDIDLVFCITDSKSLDIRNESDIVHIQTDADSDPHQSIDGSGFVALNRDGFKIVVKKLNVTPHYGYVELFFYVENNTDADITLYSRDISANGFMMREAFFMCRLLPGRKAFESMSIPVEELKENGIRTLEKIELTFMGNDPQTYEDIFMSNNIRLVFRR